jgi:hypothetical protein
LFDKAAKDLDIGKCELLANGTIKDRYFKRDYPTWTAVGVASLGGAPGPVIESKAVAVTATRRRARPLADRLRGRQGQGGGQATDTQERRDAPA